MHIGAALVFDPLPGGGTPTSAQLRAHLRARVGARCRASPSGSRRTHAGPLRWLTWEPDERFDLDAHVHHADAARARAARPSCTRGSADFWSHRLDRTRPLWEMVLLDGLAGRPLGAGDQDPPLPGRRRRLARHRPPAARRRARARRRRRPSPAARRRRQHGDGRFWLSPGAGRARRARRPRRGAPPARVARARRARARRAARARRGDRRAAVEPQRPDERHAPTSRRCGSTWPTSRRSRTRSAARSTTSCWRSCAGGLRAPAARRAARRRPTRGLRAQVPVNIRSADASMRSATS